MSLKSLVATGTKVWSDSVDPDVIKTARAKGITGATHLDLADVEKNIARIRKATRLPIGVGFGIRDGATARAICEFADAAVIGSRIVQEVESAAPGQAAQKVGAFLRGVRQAMDADRKVPS